MDLQALVDTLPTLEELAARGSPFDERGEVAIETLLATEEEQARAARDRAGKPKHLATKRRSEALCKRQLQALGATVSKARDDLRTLGCGVQIRVSTDVDYVGTIPLRLNESVVAVPLRVESKGITLTKKVLRYDEDGEPICRIRGSFPLENLSGRERDYLTRNRQRGGLSAVHISWWSGEACAGTYLIAWKDWAGLEEALAERGKGELRFSGKSLRHPADLDLLAGCEVVKVGGRWTLPPNHWLHPFLPVHEQPVIF